MLTPPEASRRECRDATATTGIWARLAVANAPLGIYDLAGFVSKVPSGKNIRD